MATPSQIAANRRNALLSCGPKTKSGKERSRRNALRHGLTAETVIGALEDRKDYRAFEAAIAASYEPRSPLEHALIARLASLLWRLRRATAIEAGLFQIQAKGLAERRRLADDAAVPSDPRTAEAVKRILAAAQAGSLSAHAASIQPPGRKRPQATSSSIEMAQCFLRLTNLNNEIVERLTRYESCLWRQAAQLIVLLSRTQG